MNAITHAVCPHLNATLEQTPTIHLLMQTMLVLMQTMLVLTP